MRDVWEGSRIEGRFFLLLFLFFATIGIPLDGIALCCFPDCSVATLLLGENLLNEMGMSNPHLYLYICCKCVYFSVCLMADRPHKQNEEANMAVHIGIGLFFSSLTHKYPHRPVYFGGFRCFLLQVPSLMCCKSFQL